MKVGAGEFITCGNIGVVAIDSPPVNALGLAVRTAIKAGFESFAADPAIRAIVLICRGRTFFAGADINELGKPPVSPTLHEVHEIIENCGKPTIAAIHGTALGGGLETALVCNFRVADPAAKLGLPEVKLGLLPGAGGTQRLTRIVGPSSALDMMLSGEPLDAAGAHHAGLVDKITAPGLLLEDSLAFAGAVLASEGPHPRVRDRPVPMGGEQADAVLDAARGKYAYLMQGYRAARSITEAVEAAMTVPFEDGIARERELFFELRSSPESAAQRHIFFAERSAARPPSLGEDVRPLPIAKIAICGDSAFAKSAARIAASAGVSVVAGPPGETPHDEAGIDITLCSDSWFRHERQPVAGPLVVVAPGKQTVAQLRTMHNVAGLRFFRPTALGRLLEVIELPGSDPALLAGLMRLGRMAGCIPVLASAHDRFIAERVIGAGTAAALHSLSEGYTADDIETACRAFGLPFSLLDPSPFGLDPDLSGEEIGPRPALAGPAHQALVRRLVDPMIAEASRILEEGVARRASDVDIALVTAFNWPPYTGGPLYLRMQQGSPEAVGA